MWLLWIAILSSEYFPLSEGHAWSYKQTIKSKDKSQEGTHGVFASGRAKVGDVEGIVVEGWGGADRAVLSVTDEGVRVLQMDSDVQRDPPYFLKFPLKVGATWEGKVKAGDSTRALRFEVAGEEDVSVPAGKFKAFRVKMTSPDKPDMTAEIWYARDFGEVRARYAFPAGETISELEKFEKAPIRFRCAKCGKQANEQKECCGAPMDRARYVREARVCRCELVFGKGQCKCAHCGGEKGAPCYCDTGGCSCGTKKKGCPCAHCQGKDGGDDGLGGCRCGK